MNAYYMPGAKKIAKTMPSLECKPTTGAGVATQHLLQIKSDLRPNVAGVVLAIPTIHVVPVIE